MHPIRCRVRRPQKPGAKCGSSVTNQVRRRYECANKPDEFVTVAIGACLSSVTVAQAESSPAAVTRRGSRRGGEAVGVDDR